MEKSCRVCGNMFKVKPSHYDKRHCCSRECMAKEYRERLMGENNPNFKGLSPHMCLTCGKEFTSYDREPKYCSRSCKNKSSENVARLYSMAKDAAQIAAQGRMRKTRYCANCFQEVDGDRKYCNACLVEIRSTMGRKDGNQDGIVKALTDAGCTVIDLHKEKKGIPDILVIPPDSVPTDVEVNGVSFSAVKVFLMEIKNPETGYGLSARQRKFHSEWRGTIFTIETAEEALQTVGAISR